MKITTVSASVRYSRPLGDGSYKTVELGAEATLTAQETWTEAQASLYQELGNQLKTLWTAKNGGSANGSTLDHHCQEHSSAFQRYEKGSQVWYAHKQGQEWCRERGYCHVN